MSLETRDALRKAIFASENKRGKFEIAEFFGQKIELRQPTIGQLEAMISGGGETKNLNIVPILIDYAYVPDTNEKVFEPTDADALATLPFGEDCQRVMDVLKSFMDLKVEEEVKN